MTLATIQALDRLELRKAYWAARGWKHATNCNSCACSDCSASGCRWFECQWFDPDGFLTTLPHIEESPDISERELMEVCRERGFGWDMQTAVAYDDVKWPLFSITIYADAGTGALPTDAFTVYGPTPSIARTRAALGVLESQKVE